MEVRGYVKSCEYHSKKLIKELQKRNPSIWIDVDIVKESECSYCKTPKPINPIDIAHGF